MINPELIELARQIADAESSAIKSDEPLFPQHESAEIETASPRSSTSTRPALSRRDPIKRDPIKEAKKAGELAAMILEDLAKIEGCPSVGVKVTVYGSNPWNSWLSFGANAGPVRNKAELQTFCEIITERLKRLYDLAA